MIFRFQAVWNRRLRRVPLFMSVLYFNEIIVEMLNQGVDLNSPLNTEIFNFSLLFLPSLLLLTPNFPLFSGARRASFQSHGWTEPPHDFLLTRAIDRRILHRVLTTLLTLLILAVPVVLLLFSLKHPARQVSFYGHDSPQPLLSHVAGSRLVADKSGIERILNKSGIERILIPNGQPLFLAWHIWALLTGMLGIQLLYLIDAFKRRGWLKDLGIFFRNFFILLGELILAVGLIALAFDTDLFLCFAAHEELVWVLTVPLWLAGQFCCECLFSHVEQ